MEIPQVTVITATYNKFDRIRETMDSLTIQSHPNRFYIIADDGSKNFPEKEICGHLDSGLQKDDYAIVRGEENVGTVKNLNRALQYAKGDFVFMLSEGDVFLHEDVLLHWSAQMAKSGAKMMMARYIRQDGGTAALPTDAQIRHMKQMDADRLFYEVSFGNYISGRALAYDRKWLQEQGGFDESYRLLEDLPLILKSLRRGIRPGVFDEVAIAYEGGGVSEGGRMNPILGDDHMRLLEREILPTVKCGGKTIKNYYEMMCGKRQLRRMEWAAVRAKRKMMLALNAVFM